MEFLIALLTIIMIDLVLAGDNAIVIGMTAKNLPEQQRKKAIIWGTVGAVVVRVLATIGIVWLLELKWLHLIGGVVLLFIAYKLLVEEKDHTQHKAAASLGKAIATIMVADTIMGLDNVLGVAGAAHGSYLLVFLGLAISIPIMVWGSTMFVKLIDKFPVVLYIGSAVLAYTAGKMIITEHIVTEFLKDVNIPKLLVELVLVVVVVLIGYLKKKKKA